MRFNALILAGSRGGSDPVAAVAGVSDKALAPVEGVALMESVVGAFRAAGARRIAVAASSPPVVALAQALGCEIVPAAAGPSESAAAGLAHLGAPMLLTTADHALLEPAWITDFLARVDATADVSALLARRDVIERTVPETRRTYLRFADGDWSGCNLFFFATARSAAALTLWQRVEADRKRPWRIVWRLGPGLLLRYALGRLSLGAALDRLGRTAGISARAVDCPFGLAAVDVDKPEDLALVRSLVGRRHETAPSPGTAPQAATPGTR